MRLRAFEIVAAADCIKRFASKQSPDPARALPITSRAWQRVYGGKLPELAEPWWLDVHAGDTEATGYLWVAPDLPCFSGHFPGQPILPGVMQLDWAVRLAGALWPDAAADQFSGMARVKFKAPVAPDAVLKLNLTRSSADPIPTVSMTLSSAEDQLTTARLLYRG